MHSVTTKKAALAALLVLAALLSIFAVGKRASDPAYHQASIDALAEKQETVLELTAASTAASAAITLLPGDTATPIAEKLADLSGYFLIVLCAIFLEKYLLTITSYVSFTILIPAACALGIVAICSEKLRAALGKLAWHVLLFALAIAFVIPAGVKVSSMIEDTYRASIEETIANAEQTTENIQSATSDEGEKSGLSGLFSKVTEGISGAVNDAVGQLKTVLNRFIEALAVMLVTSCLIPILVLLFFAWLVKLMLGIDLPPLRAKLGDGKAHSASGAPRI
jgi:hypothetical protein